VKNKRPSNKAEYDIMKSRAYVLLFFLIIGVRKGGNGKKDYFGVLNNKFQEQNI